MSNSCGTWPGIECLSCERLSANEKNFRKVDTFFNRKNDGIADTLRNEAYSEDEEGNTAYYLYNTKNYSAVKVQKYLQTAE
jgi:hypothetical protein